MICLCHGHEYPHEWKSESWCCGEEPEEDGMTIAEYEREESRYLDRINASDINRRIG